MATSDSNGPNDEALEGSWTPRRRKATSEKKGGTQDSAPPPDPEALAGEIDKTREELAETLDAIADKLSPKRVTARTKRKVGEAASGAVDSVKESAGHAADAVKSAAAKAKASSDAEPPPVAEAPVEVAPPPGARADSAVTPVEPGGAEAPQWTTTLPPESPSRMPVYAGAGAALVVLLLVMRRRR